MGWAPPTPTQPPTFIFQTQRIDSTEAQQSRQQTLRRPHNYSNHCLKNKLDGMYASCTSTVPQHMRNLPHPHLSRQTAAVKHMPQYTHAPALLPTELTVGISGADVECLIFKLAVKLTHCCTYLCAPVKHVYYRRPLPDSICCKESWESQPRRAHCCLAPLPCTRTCTHTH